MHIMKNGAAFSLDACTKLYNLVIINVILCLLGSHTPKESSSIVNITISSKANVSACSY